MANLLACQDATLRSTRPRSTRYQSVSGRLLRGVESGPQQNAAQRRSRLCRTRAHDHAHPCSQRRRAVRGPQDPAPEIQRSSIQQTARTAPMSSSTWPRMNASLAAAGFGAQSAIAIAHSARPSGRDQANRVDRWSAPHAHHSPGRARAPVPGAPHPPGAASASAVPPHLASRRPAARRGATTSPRSPKKPPGRAKEADRNPPAAARRP